MSDRYRILTINIGIDFHWCISVTVIVKFQVTLLASLAQLLPPHSPCSPIVSASAAAPQYVCFSCCSLIASASAAAPRLCPLQLLLPDCVCFSCCSPIASASAAAPRLCPLQLLLPNCVCFSCCSPIASTSAAVPVSAAQPSSRIPTLREHSQSSKFSKFSMKVTRTIV